MKTINETDLNDFEFWSGAKDSKNRFSHDEMEQIEYILEDIYPEGMDETALNDLFWFEPECLCEWLDIDFEEWVERPDDYWVNSWRN